MVATSLRFAADLVPAWLLPGTAAIAALMLAAAAGAHGDASAFGGSAEVPAAGEAHRADADGLAAYPAVLVIDPRRLVNVPVKINARVAGLRDALVGKYVAKGDVLGQLESPELETIQRTYAALVANIDAVEAASMTSNERLISARVDLEWRGMSPDEIKRLEATGQPIRTIDVRAPEDGYVVTVNVVTNEILTVAASGAQPAAATPRVFATIARADSVTVEANVPATVAARLKPGNPALVTIGFAPRGAGGGRTQAAGAVQQVFGFVDAASQMQRVRIALKRLPEGARAVSGLAALVSFPAPPT